MVHMIETKTYYAPTAGRRFLSAIPAVKAEAIALIFDKYPSEDPCQYSAGWSIKDEDPMRYLKMKYRLQRVIWRKCFPNRKVPEIFSRNVNEIIEQVENIKLEKQGEEFMEKQIRDEIWEMIKKSDTKVSEELRNRYNPNYLPF